MTTSLASLPIAEFLASLASKSPTPGGGAVAGVTGATAAALAEMVVAYSIGRKSLAEHGAALADARDRLTTARARCLELADADAQAYEVLNAAMRLPADDPERQARVADAARHATSPPLALCGVAADLAALCESLAAITNPHLASDLAIAGVLAASCAEAARWNVRANLPLLPESERERTRDEADRLTRSCAEAGARLRVAIEQRSRA